MTLRRCSTAVRDLVRLVGDMVNGHCSLLFIQITSSDKDDLPLLFEFSNTPLPTVGEWARRAPAAIVLIVWSSSWAAAQSYPDRK
jgi:hypothetical protein